MKVVVFGLSISSSWGNGHATLWRALCSALHARGHHVVFFERNTPYYAKHRDLTLLPGGVLTLYDDWSAVRLMAMRECADADAVIVTSYCPDALDAAALAHEAPAVSVFYDLDTGVTLSRVLNGEPVEYIGERGLVDFDLVLSYTGGRSLDALRDGLGARRVAPLYGSVDPAIHAPVPPDPRYRSELSYLATHSDDRHARVMDLLVAPARLRPDARFIIAGPQYPLDFPWQTNLHYIEHVPPRDHPAFYCSSRATLNLTREAMAQVGYCPSGRLFEAAAAGVPIISDAWTGLDAFFTPGEEIIVVEHTDDVLAALASEDAVLRRIADAARARALEQHTAAQRAEQLEDIIGDVAAGRDEPFMQAIMEASDVGNHSGRGRGQPYPATRVLQGAPSSRQPRH